jgi:hypothetical protein
MRISASRIIDRVQKYVLSRPVTVIDTNSGTVRVRFEDEEGNEVPAMTPDQMRGAKLLLDKALPNLQTVEVNKEETKTYVLRAPEPEQNTQDWLRKYGPKTIEAKPEKA